MWGYVLERHLLPVFGDFYVDAVRRSDIEDWKGQPAFPDVYSHEFDVYCEYVSLGHLSTETLFADWEDVNRNVLARIS